MCPFWILLEQRMMEVVVPTEATRRANCKAPVKSWPPTYQHTIFYRLDALPVTKPTVSEQWKEKISHSTDLLTPSSPGVFHCWTEHSKLLVTLWGGMPRQTLFSTLMPVSQFSKLTLYENETYLKCFGRIRRHSHRGSSHLILHDTGLISS